MPSQPTPLAVTLMAAGTLTRRCGDQTPRQQHRPSPEPVQPSATAGEGLSELRASLIGKLRQVNVQLFNTNTESTPEKSTPEESTPEEEPERPRQRARRDGGAHAAQRPEFSMSLTATEIEDDWYALNGVAGAHRRFRPKRRRRDELPNDGLFPGSSKK